MHENENKVIKNNLKRRLKKHSNCKRDKQIKTKLKISSKEIMLNLKANTYNMDNYINDNMCIICFKNIALNDKHFLHCGHKYHCECIKQWLTQSQLCPICKSPAKGTCSNDNANGNIIQNSHFRRNEYYGIILLFLIIAFISFSLFHFSKLVFLILKGFYLFLSKYI